MLKYPEQTTIIIIKKRLSHQMLVYQINKTGLNARE